MTKYLGTFLMMFFLPVSMFAEANWAIDLWAGCHTSDLPYYQAVCQESKNRRDRCGAFDDGKLFDMTPQQALNKVFADPCLSEKTSACYCLAYVSATKYRENEFPWNAVALHGTYCGWRSADRKANGSPLDWSNKPLIQTAIEEGKGIDSLDEVCRQHDFDYLDPSTSICKADRKAMVKMVSIALDRAQRTSKQVREQSLVLAGALFKNREHCHYLSWIK